MSTKEASTRWRTLIEFLSVINAYNAFTVQTVLDRVTENGSYRIKSIRDIPSVFDRSEHRIGGYMLSLNNIEHNVLRPIFRDPRIHFAVNCASVSCPPLPTHAFTGDGVEGQLDEVTRNVLRSPDYVRVEGGELLVSRIMDWYGQDFVDGTYQGSERDLPSFLRRYTRPDVSDWIQSAPLPIPVSSWITIGALTAAKICSEMPPRWSTQPMSHLTAGGARIRAG